MKDKLELDLQVEEIQSEEIQGNVYLTSEVDIQIEKAVVELTFYGKGQFSGSREVIQVLHQKQDFTLATGQTLEIPFQATCHFPYSPYKGRNASYYYTVEAEITIEQDEAKKQALLKKIRSVFVKDHLLRRKRVIEVPYEEGSYRLLEVESDLKGQLPYLSTAVGGASLFGISFISLPEYRDIWELIGQGVGSFLVSGLLTTNIRNALVGKFTVIPKNIHDEEVELHIFNSNKWRFVQEAAVSYEVEERVRDDRGTSTVILRETVFESLDFEASPKHNPVEALFSLPTPGQIPRIQNSDFRMIWIVKLTLTLPLGLKLRYKGEVSLDN
ncbi:MAG: hypothetical protein AAFP00_04005 [Bacteroidota bacterium]